MVAALSGGHFFGWTKHNSVRCDMDTLVISTDKFTFHIYDKIIYLTK